MPGALVALPGHLAAPQGHLVTLSGQLTAPPGQYLTLPGPFLTLPEHLAGGAVGRGSLTAAACLVAAVLVVIVRRGPAGRLPALAGPGCGSTPIPRPPLLHPVALLLRTAALRRSVFRRIARPGRGGSPLVTPLPEPVGGAAPVTSPTGSDGRESARRQPDPIRLAAGLAGIAVAVVVGGWPGLVAGVLAAGVADRLLRRIEPPAVRNRRLAEVADLPLAADLLAAAMRAGAPVDRAVTAVAEALGGPLADRLGRVGRSLRLGGGPDEAWAYLAPVAGADRLVDAAVRSAESGAALAGALTRLADDLRSDRATAAEASARRAGVLIVLPLGLCFLPAFILAGLVPVIVAVLGDVL